MRARYVLVYALLGLFLAGSLVGAQTPKSAGAGSTEQIVALERQFWEAWKNQDAKFFEANMPDNAVGVGSTGVSKKPQILKEIAQGCQVKSYSLMDTSVVMLRDDLALLTFRATQDAMCGGEKVPPTVWASSLYERRAGKWVNLFHQETPAAK